MFEKGQECQMRGQMLEEYHIKKESSASKQGVTPLGRPKWQKS